MLISGYDYIQFLTEQLTNRLNAPKQSHKPDHKDERSKKSGVSNRWFGMLPFAFKTMLTKQK